MRVSIIIPTLNEERSVERAVGSAWLAGASEVIVVDGGYGGFNGVSYLEQHGVEVQKAEGPKDPRTQATLAGA